MQTYPQIILNPKAKSFDGRHPWVMSRTIIEPTFPISSGSLVELVKGDGTWVGRGVYNSESQIRVRLYQWEREGKLDESWLTSRLDFALQLRKLFASESSPLEAVRLVNSEGDGLSGLIIDQFAGHVIIQITAFAMWEWRNVILDWVKARFSPTAVRLVVDGTTASNEGLAATDEWVHGNAPEGNVSFDEHGVQVSINLQAGQKTGYYLDQRANRRLAASWIMRLSQERKPLRMLDVCCYLGGFSLAASKLAPETEILAIDSSAKALAAAKHNAELNAAANVTFMEGDCFDSLQSLVTKNEKFDAVVLDPPRMASHRKQVPAALRAYHRLNLAAVSLLNEGGLLVSCSCTGRVGREDFIGVLASVSKRTKRQLQLLEVHGADFDHPVAANCPEGEYLKCAICRVG